MTVADDILERLLRMAEWWNPELFRYGMSPRSLGILLLHFEHTPFSLDEILSFPKMERILSFPSFDIVFLYEMLLLEQENLNKYSKKPIEIFSRTFLIHYRCFPDLIGGFPFLEHFRKRSSSFGLEYSSH